MKTFRFLAAFLIVWLAGPAAAQEVPRRFESRHEVTISGRPIPYVATVEEFAVNDDSGRPAASLFATTYRRSDIAEPSRRPVVFLFNGGPSVAAIGLHMQFGPWHVARGEEDQDGGTVRFQENPDSLLDVADLVMFDPAETGYSRILPQGDRAFFYSVEGDADALAQLVIAWRERYGRQDSPLFLLGESYGSIRQVVAGDILSDRDIELAGQVIVGDSIFLMETSRRTHNIVSTAVSFPLLAMTAAYHNKADRRGLTDAELLDEVYEFSMREYLPALALGNRLPEMDRRGMADRLAAYSGISAAYYLSNGLAIAKHDFNRELLPGKLLDSNDTRIARPLPPPAANSDEARAQRVGELERTYGATYSAYMRDVLGVDLGDLAYQIMAPGAFDHWDWGTGCNAYIQSAGLCNPETGNRSVFLDYDWPEVLKRQFADPDFRTMIVAAYYDGLSSIGTHRYLAAQLDYPADRFSLREYAAGHMTADDPIARPAIVADIKGFLASH
jgi:carboxypeptidase C (cathepsin A)